MSKLRIQIAYAGRKTLSLNDTLESAVSFILTSVTLKDYEPLKIIFPGTGKVLYFDRNLFAEFNHGGLHYSELIERTQCDDVYRNWLEIEVGREVVEPGALWKLQGNELTLVDDDRYVTCVMPKEGFRIAE